MEEQTRASLQNLRVVTSSSGSENACTNYAQFTSSDVYCNGSENACSNAFLVDSNVECSGENYSCIAVTFTCTAGKSCSIKCNGSDACISAKLTCETGATCCKETSEIDEFYLPLMLVRGAWFDDVTKCKSKFVVCANFCMIEMFLVIFGIF